MTIEQKRRELFELWAESRGLDLYCSRTGLYDDAETLWAWSAWRAALDAVVIDLDMRENRSWGYGLYKAAVDDCRAAIESTGLGLKVKP